MTVYDLTPLTRHADKERRWIVKGRDFQKRKVIISALALIPGLILLAFLMPLLGLYALIAPLACVMAAFWLFDAKSRKGLRVANWRRLTDRRAAKKMSFRYAGHDVQPLSNVFHDFVWCSQPVAVDTDAASVMRDIVGDSPDMGTKQGQIAWSVDLPDDTRSSDRTARVNPALDETW